MQLTRLLCLASALLCLPMCAAPAVAQLGQYQAVPRTLQNGERNDVLLDVNGAQVVSSGATNGSPPTTGPTVVAGTDGTNVRTLSATGSGILKVNVTDPNGNNTTSAAAMGDGTTNAPGRVTVESFNRAYNGSTWDRIKTAGGAEGTTGLGLLGVGGLSWSGTAFTRNTSNTSGHQIVSLGQRISVPTTVPAAQMVLTVSADNTPSTFATAPYMWDGTQQVVIRGDQTSGLWTSQKGGTNISPSQVSVGTTATLIAAARAQRHSVILSVGAANTCAFGPAGVTLATGFPLQPVAGATITLPTAAAVYAVCSATTTVSDMELF